MAEPTAQTITLAIGQSKVITVTMDAAPAGGVASWIMRFRLRQRGKSVLIEKTLGDGVTITDAVNGVWTIALSGADTENLLSYSYDWSFWRTDVTTEAPIAFGTTVPYTTAEIDVG